jgi:hypothetical protein
MKSVSVSFAVVVVLAVTGVADAQTPLATAKFEIMPVVGYRSGVRAPAFGRTELGGVLVGAQLRGRLHPNLSLFATGAYSGWNDHFQDAVGNSPNGSFRWVAAGVSADIRLKGVVPLSLVVAPGILEERYDAATGWNLQTAPAGRATHRMVAFGMEAMFPLRGRLLARGGVRDHVISWDDESLGRAHIWAGYVGIGVGLK